MRSRGARRLRRCRLIRGSEFRDEEATGSSEDNAKQEGQRKTFEARSLFPHGNDGVHDGCTAEDDRHDRASRSGFVNRTGSTEREHEGERTESTGKTGNEAPVDPISRETEVGSP
ncbi:MAG: hypothetical protein RL693_53, partial [Verrucomicrobiota bacterium]